jgi:hypothetical protein
MSFSRAVPSGGSLAKGFRSPTTKTVDGPNAYSKFSKKGSITVTPSKTNQSVVFDKTAPMHTPRSGRRSVSPDPDTTRRSSTASTGYSPGGKRISSFESMHQARVLAAENATRYTRKVSAAGLAPSPLSPRVSVSPNHRDPVVTGNGVHFTGGKSIAGDVPHKNSVSSDLPPAVVRPTSKKVHAPTHGIDVHHPESMPEPSLQVKQQRFRSTPPIPTSLRGVFKPEVATAPPKYVLRAPFHTGGE